MTRWPAPVAMLLMALLVTSASAQTRRRAAPPKPVPPTIAAAALECPSALGVGVTTKRAFCDVLTGRDPAGGILIALPPHTGDVTLTFDLHNRHTYSEELIKTNRAYRRYTATIGVLTPNNFLLSRFVIQSEFRTPADLVDRVGGGAGPGGAKAVAPTGTEPITIVIPAEWESVSILGDKLTVIRPEAPAETFTAAGRPIAVISNAQISYRPKPVPAPKKPVPRKPAPKPRATP